MHHYATVYLHIIVPLKSHQMGKHLLVTIFWFQWWTAALKLFVYIGICFWSGWRWGWWLCGRRGRGGGRGWVFETGQPHHCRQRQALTLPFYWLYWFQPQPLTRVGILDAMTDTVDTFIDSVGQSRLTPIDPCCCQVWAELIWHRTKHFSPWEPIDGR